MEKSGILEGDKEYKQFRNGESIVEVSLLIYMLKDIRSLCQMTFSLGYIPVECPITSQMQQLVFH